MYHFPTEKAFEISAEIWNFIQISVFSTEALNFTEISVKFQWPLIYNKDFTEIPLKLQWTLKFHKNVGEQLINDLP